MKREHCYIPVVDAIEPRDGEVLTDRWWIITPEACIILYNGHSPQCNSNRDIALSLAHKVWPEYGVAFLPAVYLGHIKERWDLA